MRKLCIAIFLCSSFIGFSQPENTENSEQTAPSTLQLIFFAIIVEDLDASIKWYENVLGFKLVKRNAIESRGLNIANLKSGSNRLELIQIDSSISPKEVVESGQRIQGLFKVGFGVNQIESYLEKIKMLTTDNLPNIVLDPISSKKMMVFKDPDGNRIQLFEY